MRSVCLREEEELTEFTLGCAAFAESSESMEFSPPGKL
jgi:hypothetical protein